MGFRNPLYLDLQLLKNLADYHGIDVPIQKEVVRKVAEDKTSGIGLDKAIQLKRDVNKTAEVTETYSTEIRPVRLVNDVIDYLIDNGDLTDLTSSPKDPVSRRSLIEIEGQISQSPATLIGSFVQRFMPILVAQAAQGSSNYTLTSAQSAEISDAAAGGR
ncbi:hypothetical protein ACFQES_36105 [Nonomuraea salmonea]|uniref:DUF6414 family protein n=1 Tax=Nonomuraea salmonea TaxID=46181 RepID=UPI00360DF1A8